MQLKAKEALEAIDKILKKKKISYYVLAGSALGAIRHKDMIPWDDDIDIGIFFSDSDIVAAALAEELPDEFEWIDKSNDITYPRLHGKVLYHGYGVVDVFPLVKTSNSLIAQRIQWMERKIIHKLYKTKKYSLVRSSTTRKTIKNTVAEILSKFISEDTLAKRLNKIVTRYESIEQPIYYLNIFSIYSLRKERINSKWITPGDHAEFGGNKYPVFSDCDSYLKNLYGNYMALPPIEKRVPGHPEKYKDYQMT